ncbi:MAG: hypothetical protein ISP41_17610, partial [Alphaproteobacteria bacterium]|nr:hypothetical protein [Alphaproteobacteria bacterium]
SLLDAEAEIGMSLTEGLAMRPASSVSGLYFARPQARYFGLGSIGSDQLADYAKRKAWTLEEARNWLSPNLDDDPRIGSSGQDAVPGDARSDRAA